MSEFFWGIPPRPAGAGEIFIAWLKSGKEKPARDCLKKFSSHKTKVKSGENVFCPKAFISWHRRCLSERECQSQPKTVGPYPPADADGNGCANRGWLAGAPFKQP
jgi:hypothetical protein